MMKDQVPVVPERSSLIPKRRKVQPTPVLEDCRYGLIPKVRFSDFQEDFSSKTEFIRRNGVSFIRLHHRLIDCNLVTTIIVGTPGDNILLNAEVFWTTDNHVLLKPNHIVVNGNCVGHNDFIIGFHKNHTYKPGDKYLGNLVPKMGPKGLHQNLRQATAAMRDKLKCDDIGPRMGLVVASH